MRIFITALIFFTIFSSQVLASDLKTYEQPVLLTSIGQAADILIMKGLAKRAGVNVTVSKMATADSLKGFKTLLLVAGGSSKGLGAAKVDVSDEAKRGEELIKAAQKAEIPVLTFHIGGKARRGVLSDQFNQLAADGAEVVVVASDGDLDELFSKAAQKQKARYILVDKSFDAINILQELFPKPDPEPEEHESH